MRKKTKRNIAIVILLLIVLGILGSQLFSVGFDDFILDEDFVIPSPTMNNDPNRQDTLLLPEMQSYCRLSDAQHSICEDDRFIVRKGSNSRAFIMDGSLIMKANPQQAANSELEIEYKKNLKNREIEIIGEIRGTRANGGLDVFGQCIQNFNIEVPKKFRIQALLDDENEELYHIILYGEEVGTINTMGQPEFKIKLKGCGGEFDVKIDSISSQPYLNCDIDDDEVAFTDKFYAGTRVQFDSTMQDTLGLSHRPTKICPLSRPIIKKDLRTGDERAARFSTLYNKLVSNEVIEVAEDEVLEINYITDFREGMPSTNCPSGQYEDYGGCRPVTFEEPDVVIPISRKEFIIVGKSDIVFENSIQVADKTINLQSIVYMCSEEQPSASVGNPRNDCWGINILEIPQIGDDKLTSTIYNQKTSINPYLSITAVPDGEYQDGELEITSNRAILTVNTNILSIENTGNIRDEYYTLHNSDSQLCFIIDNKYGAFSDSGVHIISTKQLFTSQEVQDQEIPFEMGKNTYCIAKDTSQLGKVTYEITPYIKINGETFYDDEKIIKNYEVVNEGEVLPPIKQPSLWERIKEFFLKIFR